MIRNPKIGVFGGSFDPPHAAHRALALSALQHLKLDRLLIVPTGQAWHKKRTLSASHHRLAMARLGYYKGIARQMDELLAQQPECAAFAQRVLALARGFRFEAIEQLIEGLRHDARLV